MNLTYRAMWEDATSVDGINAFMWFIRATVCFLLGRLAAATVAPTSG